MTAEWLRKTMNLPNVKYMNSHGATLWNLIGLAAQVVGDGRCEVCLVPYPNGNIEGRYHQNPTLDAPGPSQWTHPYGWGLSGQGYVFGQYARKYGTNHDRLAPFIVQEHANGLLWPHSYYAQHEPEPFTEEDYLNGRWIAQNLSIFDCDRPVQAGAAYIVTTAERAKDMKQKPVYILDHTESQFAPRSLVETLDDTEEWTDTQARRSYAGSGLRPEDIDVFAPYDGFAVFTQYFLEAFGWRGVKRGEAHDFYAGDISLKGPNPINSAAATWAPDACARSSSPTRWSSCRAARATARSASRPRSRSRSGAPVPGRRAGVQHGPRLAPRARRPPSGPHPVAA